MDHKKHVTFTAMQSATIWRYLNGARSHRNLDRKICNGRID